MVAAAFDAGVRVVDSSPMYGRAEAVLSGALGERRREAFVATKVWTSSIVEGPSPFRATTWLVRRADRPAPGPQPRRLARAPRVDGAGAQRRQHRIPGRDDLSALVVRRARTGHAERADPRDPGAAQPPRDGTSRREILPFAEDLGLGVLVMRPFGEGGLLRRPFPAERLRRWAHRHGPRRCCGGVSPTRASASRSRRPRDPNMRSRTWRRRRCRPSSPRCGISSVGSREAPWGCGRFVAVAGRV